MTTPGRRPRRVLDAYRTVNGHNPASLEGDDGSWLHVGSLLEHAAMLPQEERAPYLDIVAKTVRSAIGDDLWRTGHRTDPPQLRNDSTLESRMRVFCEIIESAGALELSDAILCAFLSADDSTSAVESGRVEAVRARIAWKSGNLDVAEDRYRRVAKTARRLGSDELRVRAWIGRAIVARQAGNYPAARRYGQHAIVLAERGDLRRLASMAHHTLMVAAAVGKEFEFAVEHGWQAFLNADGDVTLESGALGNLGQLFLDAGHPTTAIAAFRAVLARRPSDRIVVPALGGLAIAAARLDRPDVVHTTTDEILARFSANAGVTAYDIAGTLVDLTRAYITLGDTARAEEFRAQAYSLAEGRGFHEIVHHTRDAIRQRSAPQGRALSPRVQSVALDVRHLVSV
ncbi:MAG: tetratricopeptide repeat protein [bacterium]